VAMKGQPFAWWHHLSTFWIISAEKGITDAPRLLKWARGHMPQGSVFVCRFSDWAATLPHSESSDKWLTEYLDSRNLD